MNEHIEKKDEKVNFNANELIYSKNWETYRDDEYFEYRKNWSKYPQDRYVSDFPLHLDIETTDLCNLKCPMCSRTIMDQGDDNIIKSKMITKDEYIKQNIAIKTLNDKAKSDYAKAKITTASYLPKLTANLQASHSNYDSEINSQDNIDNPWSAGLTLSMPLDINYKANIQSAKINYLKSKLDISDKSNELAQKYDETIDNIKNLMNDSKVKLNVGGKDIEVPNPCNCVNLNNPVDLWILSKLNKLIKKVSEDLENYKFNTIVDIQKFVWHEFCDNYIEMVKYRLYNKEDTEEAKLSKFNAQYTLYTVITNTLKLMAPFAPHFADIVGDIYKVDNLHTSWCKIDENMISEENEYIGELAKNTVASIRRYKSNKGMPLNTELKNVEIYVLDKNEYEGILKVANDIKGALNIKELNVINGKPELEQKIVEVVPNKSKIGPEFKKDSKKVMDFIKDADEETIEKILNEGLETEFGLLTKEHIKSVKRALFSKGEIVETVDIDGLVDGIAIIQ